MYSLIILSFAEPCYFSVSLHTFHLRFSYKELKNLVVANDIYINMI